jgi:hypothetical protein
VYVGVITGIKYVCVCNTVKINIGNVMSYNFVMRCIELKFLLVGGGLSVACCQVSMQISCLLAGGWIAGCWDCFLF